MAVLSAGCGCGFGGGAAGAAAGLGDPRGAREWMQRCVEAVRTAPAYKYRADKRWLNEAQQFLRTQA